MQASAFFWLRLVRLVSCERLYDLGTAPRVMKMSPIDKIPTSLFCKKLKILWVHQIINGKTLENTTDLANQKKKKREEIRCY